MRSVVDRMLGQGVLTRGLVLKCSRCRHTAFHPLDEVGRDFGCVRCLFRQPLLSGAWCDTPPNEPAWFYRLDELVYQALTENVVVPALALAELGAEAAQARHGWSFELWRGPNRQLELDFACLVDGRLSVGEAKVNGKFDGNAPSAVAEVRKTLHGATLLAADHVVFATTHPPHRRPVILVGSPIQLSWVLRGVQLEGDRRWSPVAYRLQVPPA